MRGYVLDSAGGAIKWNNIHQRVWVDDEFTLLHSFLMMLIDAFLYLAMAFYVDAVYPGKHGVPKPWYFPLQVHLPFALSYKGSFKCYVTLFFGKFDAPPHTVNNVEPYTS